MVGWSGRDRRGFIERRVGNRRAEAQDEAEGLRTRNAAAARRARRIARMGEGNRCENLRRFEGRDTTGKGGTIKRITERVSPRVFRVVALPAPDEREKSQMYMQRYVQHFPAAGEVVIFDRSWYNRSGVERVMGFCAEEESKCLLSLVPSVEQAMVDSGI